MAAAFDVEKLTEVRVCSDSAIVADGEPIGDPAPTTEKIDVGIPCQNAVGDDEFEGMMQEFIGPNAGCSEQEGLEALESMQDVHQPWTEGQALLLDPSDLSWPVLYSAQDGNGDCVPISGVRTDTSNQTSGHFDQNEGVEGTVLATADNAERQLAHSETKRRLGSVDHAEYLNDSQLKAKRPRVNGSCDEQSEKELTSTLNFTTVSGRNSFSDLVSRLLAHDENRGNVRNLRARDETGSIDKTTLTESYKNKPIARGCWACVQLDGSDSISQCSLLVNHGQWPCDSCAADKVRCELITQPVRKNRCVDCKRRNKKCSYGYTRNHELDCQQCSADGHRCVADPAKDGGILPRIGMVKAEQDADMTGSDNLSVRYVSTLPPAPKKGKAKVAEDCQECVHGGETCNYPTNFVSGPCKSCKTGDLPCTMSTAPAPTLSSIRQAKPRPKPKPKQSSKPNQSRAAPTAKKSNTPVTPRRDSVLGSSERIRSPSRISRLLRTSFRHPMVFNSDEADCAFCTDPEVQVFGFGVIWAEVVDCEDMSGFVEIQGGHADNGVPVTKLCEMCTTRRMTILTCKPHDMQPIPGAEYSDKAQAAAKRLLLDEDVQDIERHCHICFGLATYARCATESEDEDDDSSCGLQLCELCSDKLMKVHHGVLNGLVNDTANGEQDCRADAELLTTNGSLERYLKWQV